MGRTGPRIATEEVGSVFFDINGWEFVILIVLGIVILGPERLPDYAAKLGRLVRQTKQYADAARSQMQEQLGLEERGRKAVDLVVDASGAEVSIQTGIYIAKHGGRYVQVRMVPARASRALRTEH